MKIKCNVYDGHVLLAKHNDDGDWVFDLVYSFYNYRDESLFTRLMACKHESVTLPSGEEVV